MFSLAVFAFSLYRFVSSPLGRDSGFLVVVQIFPTLVGEESSR